MLRRANEGHALATNPSAEDALVLQRQEVIFVVFVRGHTRSWALVEEVEKGRGKLL